MICPQCKSEVEYIPGESECCSECGADLRGKSSGGGYAKLSSGKAAEFDFQTLASSVFSRMEEKTEIKSCEPDAFSYSSSGCSYLKVEYDRNLFFLKGSQGILKLRLTPQSGELRDILIFMGVSQDGERIRKQIPFQGILTVGRGMELAIPYQPGKLSGILSFDFRIGCKTFRETKFYQFSLDFSVFDPKESGSSIGDIIITQNQQIRAGEAGDVTYRDNLGDALKEFAKKTAPSAYELLNKLKSMPPAFTQIFLSETRWTPEQSFTQGELYQTEKLMLEWEGYRLYLINKPSVKLGRDEKQSDLLVKTAGDGLGPREYPNNTVSRVHAEIIYCEDSVNLFDKSSYGTYIDGKKPSEYGMRIPDQADVEFGDIHWHMNIQHCTGKSHHYICQICPAKNVRSLTFSRKDHGKEYYLLVWECCELGMLNAKLAGWILYSKHGSFLIRTPEEKFIALTPGTDVACKGQNIHVTYFQQN